MQQIRQILSLTPEDLLKAPINPPFISNLQRDSQRLRDQIARLEDPTSTSTLESLEDARANLQQVDNKLDLAIDKLSDVSSDIKQILAVHESRIDSAENVMERHFVQQDAIHQRIGKLRDEMNKESQEIREDIAKLQQWKWMVMGGAAIVSAMIGMGIHFPMQ